MMDEQEKKLINKFMNGDIVFNNNDWPNHVVKKILNMGLYEFTVFADCIRITKEKTEKNLIYPILEFINWYNSQKK